MVAIRKFAECVGHKTQYMRGGTCLFQSVAHSPARSVDANMDVASGGTKRKQNSRSEIAVVRISMLEEA